MEKIHAALKSDKKNEYQYTCFLQSCRENQNTQFILNSSPPPPNPSCCFWDNVKKYVRTRQDRDGRIIRRMLITWWITKVADRHSEYAILTAFPRRRWFREHSSLLPLYLQYIACLVSFLLTSLYEVTARRRIKYVGYSHSVPCCRHFVIFDLRTVFYVAYNR